MAPARVLVVDDSPTMRGMITAVLNSDPEFNVIGQCGDALEARAKIKELNPDVVTLDIEMPNMSGLEFLEKIMTLRPMPVIMVSSLTQRGAEATIAALEIGAFDCIGKPAPDWIELALRLSGAAPEACVFIGDNDRTDGGAAKAAGVRFVHLRRMTANGAPATGALVMPDMAAARGIN